MTTPIVVRAVRHQCPYCRRTWAKRAAAVAHIARCWHNPAVRGCKTCANFWPFEPGGCYSREAPERCGVGRDITAGLVTGCRQWAAA